MDRPDVEIQKRKTLSLKEKLDVLTRHPYCPVCRHKLGALAGVEFDHSIPLALGGTNDLSNFRGLHANCHKLKTQDDQSAIAKAKRIEKRRKGERRPRKAIPSRPFPKRKKSEPSNDQQGHRRREEGDAEPEEE